MSFFRYMREPGESAFVRLPVCIETGINVSAEKKKSSSPFSTTDHTKFEVLQQTFETATDVLKVCLSNINEAGTQIRMTTYRTWQLIQAKCRTQKGRLDRLSGIYMSDREMSKLLDKPGWFAMFDTLGIFSLSGQGRLFT